MQRCPCCNARLIDAASCPRCKADLQEIIHVQQLAKICYQKAIAFYLQNEMQNCLDALTRSLQLRHSESASLFKAFAQEKHKQTTEFFKLQRTVQNFIVHSKLLAEGLINKLVDSLEEVHFEKNYIIKNLKKNRMTRYFQNLFAKLHQHTRARKVINNYFSLNKIDG